MALAIEEFSCFVEHQVYYSTRTPVPIGEVVEALQGLERLLHSLPRALEKVTAVHIADAKIFVERVESGSLLEKVMIKLFFKSEQELEDFLDRIRANLDGKPMLKNALITAVVAGLAAYGILLAAKALQQPTPNITANNNVIINIGAGEVNMSPEEFRAIVETAVKDKKDHAKAAVKFVKPARGDGNASITFDGNEAFDIEPRAIAETPAAVHLDPIRRVEELKQATVLIRAGDMDKAQSGWAGAVQGVTERLPIELDPTVSPVQLFGRQNRQVVADVAITYQQDGRSGTWVPKALFIRAIY